MVLQVVARTFRHVVADGLCQHMFVVITIGGHSTQIGRCPLPLDFDVCYSDGGIINRCPRGTNLLKIGGGSFRPILSCFGWPPNNLDFCI